MSKAIGAVLGFFSISVIGFAITIIVVVAEQLWPNSGYYDACYYDYTTNPPTQVCGTYYNAGICLMTNNSVNICRYSYAAGAIGIIIALFGVFAMCLPAGVTLIVNAIGAIWWLGYAITVTVYNNNVSNMSFDITVAGQTKSIPYGYPEGYYRNICIALAWTSMALCMVSLPLALKAKSSSGEDGPAAREADVEYAKGEVQAPPPPPAVV